MARFYAKFDAGTVSPLDNTSGAGGYFNRLRVGSSSGSGALLRDGLIASRSAVSADVYDDLDSANRDGSKGIYFPPDIDTLPTATLISWSTAYTSSVDGIKTPVTNAYGVVDSINYSKRPTASILSTQTSLVGPTNPLDPVQLNYATYISASSAVRTVVNNFQTLTGTTTTPYTRPGIDDSLTIHSLWHNPTLDYFAWDDFSPGTASISQDIDGLNKFTNPPEVYPGGTPVNTDLVLRLSVNGYEFINDGNKSGKIGLNFKIGVSSSIGSLATLALDGGANGGPLTIGTYTSSTAAAGNRGGASTWSWNNVGDDYSGILTWTIGLTAGEYNLTADGIIYDVYITSNTGQRVYVTEFPTTNTFSFVVKDGDGQ